MIGNININMLEEIETQVIRENKRETQLGKQLKADQNSIKQWSDDQRGEGKHVWEDGVTRVLCTRRKYLEQLIQQLYLLELPCGNEMKTNYIEQDQLESAKKTT